MTSRRSAASGASAGTTSTRRSRAGTAASSTEVPALDLKKEISGGLVDSVRLAREMVNDETLPAYVRVTAMNFFAKNQHLAETTDDSGKTLRDEFLELMAEIRSVPKVVTTSADEELEEEDEPVARFEAAPS